MKNLHANCTHPRRARRRYGARRRQCTRCKKTFRIRQHRRGRTPKRVLVEPAVRFVKRELLAQHLPRSGPARSIHQRLRELSASRKKAAHTLPHPPPPDGPLILVADAVVKYMGRSWHTWYFTLVRSVDGETATILPPYHRTGTEIAAGWGAAMAAIDADVRERIVALVSDGHRGLVSSARLHSWHFQRCHFHLLKRLQGQRSRFQKGRNQREAENIYKAVCSVLRTTQTGTLSRALVTVTRLRNQTASREVRAILSGFLTNYADYRTYLRRPEFNLPTTNNTAESLVSLVERMCTRAHGFRTIRSLEEWIGVLCKVRKTIACRKHQPN